MKKCPNCGKISERKYCSDCGYDLREVKDTICPACGHEADANFCPNCGTSMSAPSEEKKNEKTVSPNTDMLESIKVKVKTATKEQKIVTVAIVAGLLLLCFWPFAGGTSYNSSYDSSSYDTETNEKDASSVDDSTVRLKVKWALIDKIGEVYPSADKYTYDIATIDRKDSYIYAYGTVTLYDKYGEIIEYNEKFEVTFDVSPSGTITEKSCYFRS